MQTCLSEFAVTMSLSLQEGFDVPKWFQLPLQSCCHGLRYVPASLLLAGPDIENDPPPVLEIPNWLHESACHRSLFPNQLLHQKQVAGLWLWREKGEKMIDCCGKTLDEWLAAANVEAAGRKILKQNLCTKARFYKQPNCLLPTYHQLLFTRSLGAGGWEVFDDRRTDRRGIAHSSSWISSPFHAAPVQNEVRLHPCSTRAGLTVLNPVLPCWWWENMKCFLQMQQTVK